MISFYWHRRGRVVACLAACWGVLIGVQIITPLWYPTPDACSYLSIARSLASGEVPTNLGSRNLVFGIGYPVILCPAFWTSASPFLLVTSINAALAMAYVAGVIVWVRRFDATAWPIALMALGNAVVLAIFRRALSEPAFMAGLIWFVVCLPNPTIPVVRVRAVAASAGLLLVIVLIRPTGILFAFGWAVLLSLNVWRGVLSWRRAAALAAVVTVPAATALTINLAHGRAMEAHEKSLRWSNLEVFTRSEGAPVTGLSEGSIYRQCWEGLHVRIAEVGRLVVPGMFGAYAEDWWDPNLLVCLPLFALLWLGWVKLIGQQPDVFLVTFPLYFALHVYWPFNQAGRYFSPVLPLILLCLRSAPQLRPAWRLPLVRVLLVAHFCVAVGHWLLLDQPKALRQAQDWADVERLANSIRTQAATVQVTDGLTPVHLQLQFLLDRPVKNLLTSGNVDPEVRWLVIGSDDEAPAGFDTEVCTRRFRLLRRPHQSDQRVP
jgi:hypothetical protein